MSKLISDKYNQWAKECEARFQKQNPTKKN